MVEHVWSVLCSHGVVDRESNNLSLHNVIEQINVSSPELSAERPIVISITLTLVSLWMRTEEDQPCRGRARTQFVSPSGNCTPPHEYAVDLSLHSRSRTIAKINGLPLREAGHHYFRVELMNENETEWQTVARIPLQIIHTPAVQPPAG